MAVQFRPTIKPREFILTLGVGGTGKSKALLDIARKCKDSIFYVWDNDYSYERLLATQYSDIAEREDVEVPDEGLGIATGNVVIMDGDLDEWTGLLEWLKLVKEHARFDDWVAVDSMTPTWQAVQGWFSEQVFGSDIADYFLEVRMKKAESKDKKKALGALDGWMDWPVINKQYAKLYSALLNIRCHKYVTAEQDKIGDDDDAEVKKLFGVYSVKPRGQKALGHRPMTVLILSKSRAGEYAVTTVKDRGRMEMEDEEIGDFAIDYLKTVAGWKMTKVDA